VTGPRIFGIPATEAPIVAVIRRGPSDWVHIGAWNTAEGTYEPGAWLRGVIYPQKCDLSPDGSWLLYSAMKVGSEWAAGDIYEAISRLPWLTALAAWNSGTTYTRGMHFEADTAQTDVGLPDVGDASAVVARYGLSWTRPDQFAVERRRGWVESIDTPQRDAGGAWDENRRVEMMKRSGDVTLHVEGRYAAFRTGDPADGPPVYWMTQDDELEVLDGVQWADWDHQGRLLVATTGGILEARPVGGGSTVIVADLARLQPKPRAAPDAATEG
jgi:hypothetical protein